MSIRQQKLSQKAKNTVNGSQLNWQKWKSIFLSCHRREIYREEAVGPKKFHLYLRNNNFCEYVKFGAISLNIDIL